MSSVTTTKIDTNSNTTSLTLTTGNTSGPNIVIAPNTAIYFKANSSSNSFVVNTTAFFVNAAASFSNSLTVSSGNTSLQKTSVSNLTSNEIGRAHV